MRLFSLFFLFLLGSSPLYAAAPGWTKRESWISRLSPSELARVFGAMEGPDDEFETVPATIETSDREVLDWRAKNGASWVGPALNQGSCGSCVAMATAGVLEAQANIASGLPWLNSRFSSQALFACGHGSCALGWIPALAVNYVLKHGIPDEACAPYTLGSLGHTLSCRSICPDFKSRSQKVLSASRPTRGLKNIAAVKAALRHGPLLTMMTVYTDFLRYGSGVYRHESGRRIGGHSVMIVGFDDTTRSWIIRNSWGADWGEEGFAHVSWDDVSGVGKNTWSFEVPAQYGYLALNGVEDRDYVSGVRAFGVNFSIPGATGATVSLVGKDGGSVSTFRCAASPCSLSLDSRLYPDGNYTLAASAAPGPGGLKARSRSISIVNSTPRIWVRLLNADRKATLRKRVVFRLATGSSLEVPIRSLEIVVKKGQNVVYRRKSDDVLPNMSISWRTQAVPNGFYTISFRGELPVGGKSVVAESDPLAVEIQN